MAANVCHRTLVPANDTAALGTASAHVIRRGADGRCRPGPRCRADDVDRWPRAGSLDPEARDLLDHDVEVLRIEAGAEVCSSGPATLGLSADLDEAGPPWRGEVIDDQG